jgi:hypothetical protein
VLEEIKPAVDTRALRRAEAVAVAAEAALAPEGAAVAAVAGDMHEIVGEEEEEVDEEEGLLEEESELKSEFEELEEERQDGGGHWRPSTQFMTMYSTAVRRGKEVLQFAAPTGHRKALQSVAAEISIRSAAVALSPQRTQDLSR